ncbi:MAG: protein kinase domain-containing protein, partial [Bacteroidales bacterium]
MPSPGMRFGRYELLERLGAGGMGEVFRARDHDLQRDVAIKFLPERFAGNPDRLARFTREALAASSLNHPNIVTVHEIGHAGELPYMVIEFVDGETLRKMLERPLPVRRTLDLAIQLADGLAKAHAAGIVHRDLKPENVMVNRDGVLKILDFGLARTMDDGGDVAASSQEVTQTRAESMTSAGAVLGTVGYMSPEQARGERADHRSDQFAFGALLYEMATGRRAFARPSAVETLAAIIDRDPEPPISATNSEFPPPAAWVAERCLSKDPAERYASTQDLAHELRSIRDHVRDGSAPSVAGNMKRPRAAGRRLWPAAVAVVLAAAMVVAYYYRGGATLPPPRSSEERRVVVLPVQADSGAKAATKGLLEYVVMRLADLNRFDRNVSVVPASEVVEAGVKNVSGARRRLGATHAVGIAVATAGADLRVNVELSDADHVRMLKTEQQTLSTATFSPEQIVDLVVRAIAIDLSAQDRTTWNRGVPAVAGAAALFAQGLSPYERGRIALQQKGKREDIEAAIALFNQAIEREPNYAAAYAGLGEAHLLLYRMDKSPADFDFAEKLLTKALVLDDTRPSVWISLGMAYTEKGDVQKAADALAKAIASNPAGADAYRELGNAYARAGDNAKAEASYRRALAIQEASVANHSYYAIWLYYARRTREAIEHVTRALELAPDNATLLSNLGGFYIAGGDLVKAEDTLKRAAALGNEGAVSNLAYMQFGQGRYADAADGFEKAARLSGRDADIWRNAGSARYFATGRRAAAAPAYKAAAALLEQERKIDPHNPHTLVRLADCYAMLGQIATARKLVSTAVERPLRAEDRLTAAVVYEQTSARKEALEQVQAAL